QGVAARESGENETERRPRRSQRSPQLRGVRDIEVKLVAVLARVAGARDEYLVAVEDADGVPVIGEVGKVWHREPRGRLEDCEACRTLHGDECRRIAHVVDLDVEPL